MALSDITIKTIYKSLSTIILVVLFLYLSYLFIDIIILLVISIFIAMIYHPLVTLLENSGLKRIFAVLLVFAVSGVVIFFGLNVLIPKIANQINALTLTFNQNNINDITAEVELIIKEYIPFIPSEEIVLKFREFFSDLIFNSVNNISNIVTSIVSVISISIIVPFMTFFILKDHTSIINGIINIVPNKYFEFSYYVLSEIGFQLGRFIRGWIFDAFIVGTLVAIGLAILGIQNSIIIGVIAGIGHLIPYFGPVIGGIPALIISLIQFGNMSMLPEITILFIIIYSIDNGYIQPNIFSKSTDLHPLMIILLILMGSQIMGVLGMLIAIPAATVIKTAAKEFYFGYKNYKIIRT